MEALTQIGFFANNSAIDENALDIEDIAQFEKFDGLFSFDSNFTIPFETGIKSVMIIGSTGSGKTASVVLPMIKNCIKEDLGGIILDVKGNLRGKVRAIADSYGRIDDVVEFGASDTSCKTNIIGAMDEHIVADLFRTFSSYGMSGGGDDKYFFEIGAKICTDVYRCLKMLSESRKENEFLKQFTPTMYKIYQVICDRQLALGIWTLFLVEFERRKKYKYNITEWKKLINDVQSNRFHLFKDAESFKKTDSTYEEQMAWNLNNMIRVFANIDQTHNILQDFSCEGEDAINVDFDKLIYQENKIVLVHFPIDCGFVGDIMSKTIKEMYYTSVIKNGLDSEKITFMVADEFQNIIDLDKSKKLDDASFLSVSREYKNINIFATQSISALNYKNDNNGVLALLNNCMTKIFLQCLDMPTMEWQRKIFYDFGLCGYLERGDCIVNTFDENNKRIDRCDSVNNEFNEVHRIKMLINCNTEGKSPDNDRQSNVTVGFIEQIQNFLYTKFDNNFFRRNEYILDKYDISLIKESKDLFGDYKMFMFKKFTILRFIASLGKNVWDNKEFEKYKRRYVALLKRIRHGLGRKIKNNDDIDLLLKLKEDN